MNKNITNAEQVRSAQDLELYKQLLGDNTVQEFNKALTRKEQEGPLAPADDCLPHQCA
jgi:hypothetical protein